MSSDSFCLYFFYRCVENISFRGHVLALNFDQYNRPDNLVPALKEALFLLLSTL